MQTSRKLWLGALALAALGALPAAAEAPKLDPLVPADSELVMALNVRQLFDAPLVKKHALKELQDALQKNDQVGKLLAAAGVDPFKDVSSVVISAAHSPANNKLLVVVRGHFDPDKIHKVAADVAEKKPGELKLLKEGGRNLYELKAEGKPAYATFADKGTLVISPSKEYALETAQNAGKKAAKPNKELAQALSKVNGQDAVWLAAVITDEVKNGLKRNPATTNFATKLESVTGGVSLTDSLMASILVHTTEAAAAKELSKLAKQGKTFLAVMAQGNDDYAPFFNELLSNLKIIADDSTLKITLKVTPEVLDKAPKKDSK